MRKEDIYNEVINMLNDRIDYKSITLAEVARRCDMGKSTIYEFVKSKDELVYESILFYLNKMLKTFVENFEITTFRKSLKTYIKAVAITMKANFWLVYPWTFTDNYSGFLLEEDAKVLEDMLNKGRSIVYTLFSSILEKGAEEDVLYKYDENQKNFAFNGLISSLAGAVSPTFDVESAENQEFIENLCSCVVKQLN